MTAEWVRQKEQAPSVEIQRIYENLYLGLRDRQDPVSWRTTGIDIKKILGVQDPEHQFVPLDSTPDADALISDLLIGTDEELLIPEIRLSLGLPQESKELPQVDALLFNGRHCPETLLWTLNDYLKMHDLNVATINPVGHFNDKSTRIVGPFEMLRPVDKLIILASTQESYGGNVSVLANTMRLIRNPQFSQWVNEVDIVMPMFGGSRGDKPGQDESVGYEVLEAIFNPKQLALPMRDILDQLKRETSIKRIPHVRFITVDIHSQSYPGRTFEEYGFSFESACPQKEFANAAMLELERMEALDLPIRFLSMDKGAVTRTELMAYEVLTHPLNRHKYVEIAYMDKTRKVAGEVDNAKVVRVERWELTPDNEIIRTELRIPTKEDPHTEECILLAGDDIFDTGHTFETDIRVALEIHTNARRKVFAATHPVMSQGTDILNKLPIDVFLFGNTLHTNGLSNHPKVKMVDMAPAIARTFYSTN